MKYIKPFAIKLSKGDLLVEGWFDVRSVTGETFRTSQAKTPFSCIEEIVKVLERGIRIWNVQDGDKMKDPSDLSDMPAVLACELLYGLFHTPTIVEALMNRDGYEDFPIKVP